LLDAKILDVPGRHVVIELLNSEDMPGLGAKSLLFSYWASLPKARIPVRADLA
jgi:hypothetical protein